jgi:hypothetical protein
LGRGEVRVLIAAEVLEMHFGRDPFTRAQTMIRQITRISVGQTAKVIAVFYGVVFLIVVVIYAVGMTLGPGNHLPFLLVLFFPVIYALVLYVVFAGMAWIYNQIAAKIGGVEFEFRDVGSDAQ